MIFCDIFTKDLFLPVSYPFLSGPYDVWHVKLNIYFYFNAQKMFRNFGIFITLLIQYKLSTARYKPSIMQYPHHRLNFSRLITFAIIVYFAIYPFYGTKTSFLLPTDRKRRHRKIFQLIMFNDLMLFL